MLVTAAATRWGVDRLECGTRDSRVIHRLTRRQLTYFELADAAAGLSVLAPRKVEFKDPAQFRLLGTRVGGVDNTGLVTGRPLFGIDMQQPGMLYATYVKCPEYGGKVKSASFDGVRALCGVVDVFVLEGPAEPAELSSGVAIVATDT